MSRRAWWVVVVVGIATAVVAGTAVIRDLIRNTEVARTGSGAASLAAAAEGHMGELLQGVASLQRIGDQPQCLEAMEYDAVTALLRRTGMLDDPNRESDAFRDSWGQRYQVWLVREAGNPLPQVRGVRSAGPDGRFGTGDDVVAR